MAQKLLDLTAAPVQMPVVDPSRGNLLTLDWEQFFHRLPATLNAIPSVLNLVSLSEQSAAISATDFANGKLLQGVYMASYHTRVSRATSSSSSLTVTIGWTEGGVAQSRTSGALTTNTTTTKAAQSFLLRSDANAAVTYTVAYSSSGATSMQYSLDVCFQAISPKVGL